MTRARRHEAGWLGRTRRLLRARARCRRLRAPDGGALSTRLFVAFLLLSLAVVVVIVGPVVAVSEADLSRQLAVQAARAGQATEALLDARLAETAALVELMAERPTLRGHVAAGRSKELGPYLDTLRVGARLDGVVVRDALGSVVARSPAGAVEPQRVATGAGPAVAVRRGAARPGVVLGAASRLGREGPAVGNVHGWVEMDDAFLAALAAATGVSYALYLDGRPVAALETGLPPDLDDRAGRVTLPAGERHVRPVPIHAVGGERLTAVLLLPTDAIVAARRHVLRVVGASAAAVMVLATALAYLMAGSVTAPLRALVWAAERMGRGDLTQPLDVRSDVREVDRLSAAFEAMRQRLDRAHGELRHAKRWSEGLVASLPEGIVTVDAAGRITSFSAGAERILGWRAGDAIGRSWPAVLGVDPGDEDEPAAFVHARPGSVARRTAVDRRGRPLALAISTGAVAPLDRTGREQVYVVRDVTEEERAMRQREHLLANLSHELRTPLSSLRAGAEILTGAPAAADVSELARSMLVSVRRLAELVDNLLGSAGLQAGRFSVRPRRTDLETVIEEVVLEMAPVLAARSQWLDVRARAPVPDVLADPRRIAQVLVNLVSNASRFSPPGRPIVVRLRAAAEMVRVEVVDEGPGVSDEARPGLFVPFAQGGSSRTGGVGLGLSIVKAIVERHGGTIGAYDRPGGGARFTFTLRRCPE